MLPTLKNLSIVEFFPQHCFINYLLCKNFMKPKDIVLFEADGDVYGSSATIRQCLSFPVSLLSLREYLSQEYDSIILTQEGLSSKGLAGKILTFNPKIVAATASCCEFPVTADIMQEIKNQRPDIVTVVGGYHASAYPQSLDPKKCPRGINPKGIDLFVLREGEKTFAEVADSVRRGTLKKDSSRIKGLAYMESGILSFNEPRELIEDIDTLPNITWGKEELERNSFDGLVARPNPNSGNVVVVISERGCSFACSFCSTQNVYGRKVRTRSMESLGDEIENLVTNLNVDMIVDYAPTANRDPKRIHSFCEEVRKRGLGNKISLYQLWRLENPQTGKLMITEDLLEDLENTLYGFKAGIGIEALTDKDQEYLHKSHSLENLGKAADAFHKHGAVLRGFYMITPETTRDAIQNCSQSSLLSLFDDLRVTYLAPYPGSPIYEEHKGELITENWRNFTGQTPVLKSKHLDKTELANAYKDIIQGFLLNKFRQDRIKEKIRNFPQLREGFEVYHNKMRRYGFETLE